MLRLIAITGSDFGLQFWDGAAWQQPGPSVTSGTGTFDFLAVVDHAAGRLAWYHNGTLCSDVAGLDTSGMVDLARLRVGQYQNYAGNTAHSSVILASYGTIGHTVTRRPPTGAGSQNDWTGAWSIVDDDATDDTNAINTDTTAAVSTFTAAAIAALPVGSVVKCVAVAAGMRSDGGDAPAHARAVLGIGGTEYVAPFEVALSSGLAWASMDNVNCEFGLKATA